MMESMIAYLGHHTLHHTSMMGSMIDCIPHHTPHHTPNQPIFNLFAIKREYDREYDSLQRDHFGCRRGVISRDHSKKFLKLF